MTKELNISFRLLVRDDQVLVDDLLKDPAGLLDYYLTDEPESDSTFQGGFCISTEAGKWNGEDRFIFDLFRYTLNWLDGMEKLLSGKSSVGNIGYWEESIATATLSEKNEIEIVDVWFSKSRVISHPIRVDFEELCKLLVRESKKYLELTELVNKEIKKRGKQIDSTLAKRIKGEMCGSDFKKYVAVLEPHMEEYFKK